MATNSEANPFSAIIVAIPMSDGLLQVDGDGQKNMWRAVLNVGSKNNVRMGQKFVVFALGEEVVDPRSGESLGHFELVRGEGEVVHVQERMCTISSTNTKKESRTIDHALLGTTIQLVDIPTPFPFIRIGDLARRI